MPANIEGEFASGKGFEIRVWPGDITSVNYRMDDETYVSFVFGCDKRDKSTEVFVCEGLQRALTTKELDRWSIDHMPLGTRRIADLCHLEIAEFQAEDLGWDEQDSPINYLQVIHLNLNHAVPR